MYGTLMGGSVLLSTSGAGQGFEKRNQVYSGLKAVLERLTARVSPWPPSQAQAGPLTVSCVTRCISTDGYSPGLNPLGDIRK